MVDRSTPDELSALLSESEGLRRVHGQFAAAASASLSALLSDVVVVSPSGSRVLAGPAAPEGVSLLCNFSMGTDGPEANLDLDPDLVRVLLEGLFGAPTGWLWGGDLSPLEAGVLRRVVQKLLADLARSWARYSRVEPEILETAWPSAPAAHRRALEPQSVSAFEVRVGGGGGLLSLAYPARFVRSVFDTVDDVAGAAASFQRG